MRKAGIIACTLLFIATAGFAETATPAPLSAKALAAILGPAAVKSACALPQTGVVLAARRPRTGGGQTGGGLTKALCTATAACESGTVYCEGNNSSTSCSAYDRNCDLGEQGHVTCDGNTTWCPTACPCNDTPMCCRCYANGDCMSCCRCDGGTLYQCAEQCG